MRARVAIPVGIAVGVLIAAPIGLVALIAHRTIHPKRAKPTQILAVSERQVRLTSTPMTRHRGLLGLLYDSETRLAILSPDVDLLDDGVGRTVESQPAAPIRVGEGRAMGNVFGAPEALSDVVQHLALPTPLGPAPAWVFPAEQPTGTWLIHIHGSLAEREGALRSVDAVTESRANSIVPSYRNDRGAPAAPRGAFMLGQTEYADLEPALTYAIEHGATRIVLVGWSNGAAMALRLAAISPNADAIAGVIGISPVLDWASPIRNGVRALHLPAGLADLALLALSHPTLSWILGAPQPLRRTELAWTTAPRPTLLLHSPGDQTVPYSDSVAFEAANPGRVTLSTFPPAPHALEWNSDREHFSRVVNTWLDELLTEADAT